MYKLQQYTSCVLLRLPLQFNYYLIDIRSPSYQDYNIFLQISQCHLRSWYVFLRNWYVFTFLQKKCDMDLHGNTELFSVFSNKSIISHFIAECNVLFPKCRFSSPKCRKRTI